ncbi:MAG: hypothetical protein A07HB70_00671 [uncultured archaeon A07HB70]|nr:MAG: hypothetical protein A07HB70_00671 [uncultured archaeon A07HB70]
MSAEGVTDAARAVRPGTPAGRDGTGGERFLPDGPDERTPGSSESGGLTEPPGRTLVADT